MTKDQYFYILHNATDTVRKCLKITGFRTYSDKRVNGGYRTKLYGVLSYPAACAVADYINQNTPLVATTQITSAWHLKRGGYYDVIITPKYGVEVQP